MIIECPTCGQKGNVPDRDSRRLVRCKRCQDSFCIPAAERLEAPSGTESQDDAIHPVVYGSLVIALGVVSVVLVMLWNGTPEPRTATTAAVEQPATKLNRNDVKSDHHNESSHRRPVVVARKGVVPNPTSPTVIEDAKSIDRISKWERCVVTVETDQGLGSGFVVEPGDIVITNFHVIAMAKWGNVRFVGDKTPVGATVAGIEPGRDLAILRLSSPPPRREFLRLATHMPRKGVEVYAIGSAMGLEATVSDGIVSGVRSGAELQDAMKDQGLDVYSEILGYSLDMQWIQTDAAIDHGNSGGPLLNRQTGEVVGVNTCGKSESQGGNFAVSASHVRELLNKPGDTVIAWGDLPLPRFAQLRAEMEREQSRKDTAEAVKRASLVEDAKRKAEQQQRESDSQARRLVTRLEMQEEMNRLSEQAIAVRGEIETLESERIDLQQELSQLTSRGRSLEVRVVQLLRRYRTIEAQVASLTSSIDSRMIDGVIYQSGREPEFEDMKLSRAALVAQGAAIEDEVAVLQATYAGVANEVSELQSQVDYLESSQKALRVELVNLENRYERIQSHLEE